MQAAVGNDNNYGKLQFTFNNFRTFFLTFQQQKGSAKPKQQATLTDIFSRVSSYKLMSIALFIIFLK